MDLQGPWPSSVAIPELETCPLPAQIKKEQGHQAELKWSPGPWVWVQDPGEAGQG